MYISKESIDDLLNEVYSDYKEGGWIEIETSRGTCYEKLGCLLEITNPRNRISRSESRGKIFSSVGEFFWYLSEDQKLEFIEYYISAYSRENDGSGNIRSGYGSRFYSYKCTDQISPTEIVSINQIEEVISILNKKKTTRQAVIQIFKPTDIIDGHTSVPCTCDFQFFIRDEKLNMIVHMRSNDAYLGLPHDVFAFTMLQELLSIRLNCALGTYKHFVGSLHLYKKDVEKVVAYLDEGFFSKRPMSEMPTNPEEIELMKVLERKIRTNEICSLDAESEFMQISDYWRDIAYLLFAFNKKKTRSDGINTIKEKVNNCDMRIFVEQLYSTERQK